MYPKLNNLHPPYFNHFYCSKYMYIFNDKDSKVYYMYLCLTYQSNHVYLPILIIFNPVQNVDCYCLISNSIVN